MRGRLRRKLIDIAAAGAREAAPAETQALAVAQRQLFAHYHSLARQGAPLPSALETGYRVRSQFDEDGVLLFLFAVLGTRTRRFVDLGGGDGHTGSNCANLALHFGWHGLFIDANEEALAAGRRFYASHPDTWAYPPRFAHGLVKRENINQLVAGAGFEGEIDLLSIDIDGNDYWVWDALEVVQPRVVVIETHIEFGFHDIVVPYDADYVYPGQHPHYHGASPIAMKKLADSKGFTLVAANRFGFNLIFARDPEPLPELSVEEVLWHPRNPERFELFESVRHLPYESR